MQFFKFWTRAKRQAQGKAGSYDVSCFGYSNESLESALRVAEQRAQKAAQSLADGHVPSDQYYGGNHPLREEVIEEFVEQGETIAIISRNRYGCLVLNTPDVFIADIDKPTESASPPNPVMALLNMFGVVKAEPKASIEENLIDKINQHCQQDPSIALRLYRTHNGYRVIVTNKTIPAEEKRSQELLKSFGSDGLYVVLCRNQGCYRARLTPKPWRCGSPRPPCQFPFETADLESAYRQWISSYDLTIKKFATCALIGQFGSNQSSPIADQIVQLHDHYVLNGDLPIA